MRHGKGYRKLGRESSNRRALLRGLVGQAIAHDGIKTSLMKAKEVRPILEKLVTLAKVDSVAARRRAASYIYEKDVVRKLFTEVAPRHFARPGGYTRILRLGRRFGDGSLMARIEFVSEDAGVNSTKGKSDILSAEAVSQ